MMGDRGGGDKRRGICARALQDILREATRRRNNEVFTIQVNTVACSRLSYNSKRVARVFLFQRDFERGIFYYGLPVVTKDLPGTW